MSGAPLADVLNRASFAKNAADALVLAAKGEAAKAFYLHHRLLALPESSRWLFLPLAKVRTA
uniref:hypothetical protein n=1 Tax=Limnohabitans sp. DM1 TaxID=1597955 RepID=UPI000AEF226D|nr:hypothetical protein [Limnohabitans sp. DM1]